MKNKVSDTKGMCSVDYAFQRMGGKYKARILFHLSGGVMRYGALRKNLTDITPKMLTQALRELEGDELITRKVYNEVPPKVEYQLTPDGEDLIPSIRLIQTWGKRQMNKRDIPVLMDTL